MKKKILAILLSLAIPFSMISCNESSKELKEQTNQSTTSSNTNVNETNSKENSDEETNNDITDKNVNIYYYDVVNDKIVYINKSIKVENNDAANSLFEELKTSPNDDIAPAISNEIILNSTKLDKENSLISLDLSANFVTSENLGSGSESNTLRAICNTFADYFDVDNVIITLDGQPYSSGHILMSEGDSFKVDLSDSIKLN